MLQFQFGNLEENFLVPLQILGKRYGFCVEKSNAQGRTIQAEKRENGVVNIQAAEDNVVIHYNRPCELYRAIGHVVEKEKAGETIFSLEEQVFFDYNGLMFDCSRNGVVNLSFAKEVIEMMAVMGHSVLMLYMEDVYELEGEPYFGYLRGRYTKKELKELDDYAFQFGIELVPCIQTLAHLDQFFMWEDMANKYTDIDNILCVGKPEVNELIDRIFKQLSETLRTRRIHIGMDEAYNLGRGCYLEEHGLRDKKDIMKDHLAFIVNTASKYNLHTIIWDDMFFSQYSTGKTSEVKIPNEIDLMYWDYYNNTKEHYAERIQKRKEIADTVMFAGGAWRWTGYAPHHSKTLAATNAALSACKEAGIREIIATSWADDGAECPPYASLFGTVLFGEHGYHQTVDIEEFKKRLLFITDMSYEECMKQEEFDILPEFTNRAATVTPSKYLLHEDPIYSLFVYHTRHFKEDLTSHYQELAAYFEKAAAQKESPVLKAVYEFYSSFGRVMALKWNLGFRIYEAYQNKDKKALETIIETQIIPLKECYDHMIRSRRKEWMLSNKSNGYEVLDLRYGGMKQRLETTTYILNQFINGELESIPELEEERLPMVSYREDGMGEIIHYNRAQRAMTPNRMVW